MQDVMPGEVQVQERGDVVRYCLPRRQIGALRWLGLVPILFGLVPIGFALPWIATTVGKGDHWMGWVFAAFAIPFLVGGLFVTMVGLLIIDSWSEIELKRGMLRSIDTNGWLRWPRKRPVQTIRRFVVSGPGKQGESIPGVLADLAAIEVQVDGDDEKKKRMLMAVAYPRPWLRWIADDLARRCQCTSDDIVTTLSSARAETAAARTIEVVERDGEDAEPVPQRPLVQPVESEAIVEEQADGVTITYPAPGLHKRWGLFAFGVLVCLLIAAFGTNIALDIQNHRKNHDPIAAVIFLGIFGAVGIGLALGGLHIAWRSTVLVVSGDRLAILKTGLRGSSQHHWGRVAILDIRRDAYSHDEDGKPSNELQIHTRQGTKFGCLWGHSDEELDWVAYRLRQALNMPARRASDPLPFVECLTQPIESAVIREDQADGVTLTVPPAGILRGSKGLFVFSLVWIGFMLFFDGAILMTGGGMGFVAIPFLAFSVLFWLIGIAMLLGAINMGRRRAVLAVVGDRLLVMQTGIFGNTRHDWSRDQIADVRPGPSSMKINNVPVMELHVVPKQGKPTGLLSGHGNEELAWLATVLRRALRVPEAAA